MFALLYLFVLFVKGFLYLTYWTIKLAVYLLVITMGALAAIGIAMFTGIVALFSKDEASV